MTTIYLIRHGEVENPEQILYGRLSGYGLSQKGRREISQTANFLQDKNITTLYSSPLERAKESMEIIKEKLSLPTVILDENLLEVKTSFQGQPLELLRKTNSDFDWFFPPYRQENDETMEQIRDRMLLFLAEMDKKYPGQTIAVLSHGDPLMIVKAAIEKRPMNLAAIREGHYLSHGEVLKVTIDQGKRSVTTVFVPEER
ncbi:MAG: histidine phosphatase family protein [Patescibacteria group bacterium]